MYHIYHELLLWRSWRNYTRPGRLCRGVYCSTFTFFLLLLCLGQRGLCLRYLPLQYFCGWRFVLGEGGQSIDSCGHNIELYIAMATVSGTRFTWKICYKRTRGKFSCRLGRAWYLLLLAFIFEQRKDDIGFCPIHTTKCSSLSSRHKHKTYTGGREVLAVWGATAVQQQCWAPMSVNLAQPGGGSEFVVLITFVFSSHFETTCTSSRQVHDEVFP